MVNSRASDVTRIWQLRSVARSHRTNRSKLDMLEANLRGVNLPLELLNISAKFFRGGELGEGSRCAGGEMHFSLSARRRATRFLGHYGFVSFDHIDFGSGRTPSSSGITSRATFARMSTTRFAVDLIAQPLH